MSDSIHHMTLKLLKNAFFGVETSRFCHLLHNVIRYLNVTKSVNWFIDFIAAMMALYHYYARRHVINIYKWRK